MRITADMIDWKAGVDTNNYYFGPDYGGKSNLPEGWTDLVIGSQVLLVENLRLEGGCDGDKFMPGEPPDIEVDGMKITVWVADDTVGWAGMTGDGIAAVIDTYRPKFLEALGIRSISINPLSQRVVVEPIDYEGDVA